MSLLKKNRSLKKPHVGRAKLVAVLAVQCFWRCAVARARFEALMMAGVEDNLTHGAAIMIQTALRRHMCRAAYARLLGAGGASEADAKLQFLRSVLMSPLAAYGGSYDGVVRSPTHLPVQEPPNDQEKVDKRERVRPKSRHQLLSEQGDAADSIDGKDGDEDVVDVDNVVPTRDQNGEGSRAASAEAATTETWDEMTSAGEEVVVSTRTQELLGLQDDDRAAEVMTLLAVSSFEVDEDTGALHVSFVSREHREAALKWIDAEVSRASSVMDTMVGGEEQATTAVGEEGQLRAGLTDVARAIPTQSAQPVALNITDAENEEKDDGTVRGAQSREEKRIGDYFLGHELGRGAQGTCLAAWSTQHTGLRDTTNVEFAVKTIVKAKAMLRRGQAQEGKFGKARGQAAREVAIMRKLIHPHVARLVDVMDDPDDQKLYIVQEYLGGGTLMSDHSKHADRLGEGKARVYFRQLISALEYLHFQHIVHRDIKPSNCLLDSSRTNCKLCDFGVSMMLKADGDDSVHRSAGTAAFLPPEALIGKPYSGKRADMWALGCTLFMMIYGNRPFSGSNTEELERSIREDPPAFPASVLDAKGGTTGGTTDGGSCTRIQVDLLMKMLDKDPTTRIQVAEAGEHPWATQSGRMHARHLSVEEKQFIDVTPEEVMACIKYERLKRITMVGRQVVLIRTFSSKLMKASSLRLGADSDDESDEDEDEDEDEEEIAAYDDDDGGKSTSREMTVLVPKTTSRPRPVVEAAADAEHGGADKEFDTQACTQANMEVDAEASKSNNANAPKKGVQFDEDTKVIERTSSWKCPPLARTAVKDTEEATEAKEAHVATSTEGTEEALVEEPPEEGDVEETTLTRVRSVSGAGLAALRAVRIKKQMMKLLHRSRQTTRVRKFYGAKVVKTAAETATAAAAIVDSQDVADSGSTPNSLSPLTPERSPAQLKRSSVAGVGRHARENLLNFYFPDRRSPKLRNAALAIVAINRFKTAGKDQNGRTISLFEAAVAAHRTQSSEGSEDGKEGSDVSGTSARHLSMGERMDQGEAAIHIQAVARGHMLRRARFEKDTAWKAFGVAGSADTTNVELYATGDESR